MEVSVSNFPGFSGSFLQIGTAVIGLLVLIFFYKKFTGPKLPPGPFAWPLVGNLPLLGPQPHISISNLAKKYGQLMFMQLGSVPTIVVSGPEMAKEVLRTQDGIWASRPNTVTAEVFFYNQQDLLFAPLGPSFKLFRHTTINQLLTPKRVKSFKTVRRETLISFLQKLLQESQGGKAVKVDHKITEMNFNNVSRILYGKSYYGLKTKYSEREFHQIPEEWARVAGGFIVGDYLPYLRMFDIGGSEAQLKRLRAEFNVFLSGVVEEHKQKAADGLVEAGNEDFVDVLLSLPADEDGHRLTEIQIKALLEDLTIGGIDTSAAQMQWTLVELMRHPEVRLKVQEELDAVIGKERMVEESDIPRLPYMRAVIKESFRLHPAVPFLAPHESVQDTKIAGYDLPKGTRLIVNVFGIHRSEEVWPEPNKFDPSRFLNTQQATSREDFKFIPFGAGRRMCPGMEYALLVVEGTIAALLHSCDLSLPEGTKPMDVDITESFGVTLATTTPLKLVLNPRLPLSIYQDNGIAL